MTVPAKVSKALLVVLPEPAQSTAFTQSLRFKLYDAGFIVVREEHRTLNSETAAKLVSLGGFDSYSATTLVGNTYVYVVAAEEAAEKLVKFVAASDETVQQSVSSSVKTLPGYASKAVSILFPAMATDNIPSNGEAREYVQEELKGLLLSGLTELAKQRPANPIEWLAQYLLNNNPRSPPVTLADTAAQ